MKLSTCIINYMFEQVVILNEHCYTTLISKAI